MHSVYFVYEKPCSYVHVLPANAKRILKSQAVFMFCKSLVVNLWRQQFYCICIRRKYESGFIPQSTVKWFGIVQSAYRCRKLCRWKCHASRWCVMSVSIRTPINTPEGGQGGGALWGNLTRLTTLSHKATFTGIYRWRPRKKQTRESKRSSQGNSKDWARALHKEIFV